MEQDSAVNLKWSTIAQMKHEFHSWLLANPWLLTMSYLIVEITWCMVWQQCVYWSVVKHRFFVPTLQGVFTAFLIQYKAVMQWQQMWQWVRDYGNHRWTARYANEPTRIVTATSGTYFPLLKMAALALTSRPLQFDPAMETYTNFMERLEAHFYASSISDESRKTLYSHHIWHQSCIGTWGVRWHWRNCAMTHKMPLSPCSHGTWVLHPQISTKCFGFQTLVQNAVEKMSE